MVRLSIAAIAAIGWAEAFVPHSSFVGRPLAIPTTATTTCLQMNLFDRFARVAKSNLNTILQSLEDPEKIMNQALEDMQVRLCVRLCLCIFKLSEDRCIAKKASSLLFDMYCTCMVTKIIFLFVSNSNFRLALPYCILQGDLVKIRQSYAEITATQRRLMKQKEQADALAADWYKRAQLALEKGNDALAKEALMRRQTAVEEAANLQQQMDLQASSIDKLYEGMQMLEKKILESKSKKEQMVARARTAQSTQKVNDMLR
jgi:phage shock protein A